ncbi:MAG TPA: hypothetical protein DGG95_07245, partial [Cytophagales bacterium]|jgi:hypothetical protein|nr:hypothetical protein [Cytophagales bacterium]
MKIVGKLAIAFCLFFPSEIFSQSFTEFKHLNHKADSAYEARNYPVCLGYYESIFLLPENKKPELTYIFLYDVACAYSLNNNASKALEYLDKSFSTGHIKRGENPVSILQIVNDNDLDLIRKENSFQKFLERYYSKADLNLYVKLFSFSDRELSYERLLDYIEILSQTDLKEIVIADKIIYWKKTDNIFLENNKHLQIPDFPGLVGKRLGFRNCTFELNFVWNANYLQTGSSFFLFKSDLLRFDGCTFQKNFILESVFFKIPPKFVNTSFKKNFWLSSGIQSEITDFEGFAMENCTLNFVNINFDNKTPMNFTIKNNRQGDSSNITINSGNITRARFHNNNFFKKNVLMKLGQVGILRITGNSFNNLMFQNTSVSAEFDCISNKINGKFLLDRVYFNDEPTNDFDWKSIGDLKLGFLGDSEASDGNGLNPESGEINGNLKWNPNFMTGENKNDISDDQSFREIMGLYSIFLNSFKNKNDIESYNACFTQIKELQSKRLKYLYESNPSFEKYFRWKLSQLLKFYVRYGTDPARAIVISIYIIIVFGVFFFFFPSDWDTTSKSKLLQNFKDFIQKNDKGYVKPFFVLLLGFIISLINAVTLSLNAFITLGFGNIPTHGIARYFCVLEGFLGWFLLSIFTVAMINQVL